MINILTRFLLFQSNALRNMHDAASIKYASNMDTTVPCWILKNLIAIDCAAPIAALQQWPILSARVLRIDVSLHLICHALNFNPKWIVGIVRIGQYCFLFVWWTCTSTYNTQHVQIVHNLLHINYELWCNVEKWCTTHCTMYGRWNWLHRMKANVFLCSSHFKEWMKEHQNIEYGIWCNIPAGM